MRVAVVCALLFMTASSTASAAPTKDECVDADTRAQVARSAGRLREAREQLEICVSTACPAVVRSDCTERLDEVTRLAPTVIFDVKDAAGADIAATKVTMDGKPFLERLDGRAVAIDPGEHTFVFTAAGHLPNTQHVLVHEGDKERRVRVVVGALAETDQQPHDTSPPEEHHDTTPPSPSTPGSGQRVAAIVVGATGLAGLVVAAVLTGVSTSIWQTSQSECSLASCTQHDQAVIDHDTAYSLAVGATVAVIGGGVLAATGLVLFLTAPRGQPQEKTSRFRLTPLVGPANGVMLSGAF